MPSCTPLWPGFNALCNLLAFIFLWIGLWAIKSKKENLHKKLMITCFVISSLFLTSYLAYHYSCPATQYGGEGFVRLVYFVILVTHIILAIVLLPLVLKTFYHALKEDFTKHRIWAKITFPVWVYVSFTGVVIFLMLYDVREIFL